MKFEYHGPPVYVVELQQEVKSGDVVEGSDALAASAGFTPVKASEKRAKKDGDD